MGIPYINSVKSFDIISKNNNIDRFFKFGEEVSVFYNMKYPKISCLKRSNSFNLEDIIFFGVLSSVNVLFLGITFIKSFKIISKFIRTKKFYSNKK
jgi:hypothetical protein